MKRIDLIRHLERLGGNHTIYQNPANGRMSAVPRHREVKEKLARKICSDLNVPRP